MKSNFTIKWSVALCFLFSLGLTVSLNAQSVTITAPASVAGDYPVKPAAFGPATMAAISGDLVLIEDDTAPTGDGCETVVNDLTGKIALVDRGVCGFPVKAINAQTAGAIAVIVCNSVANAGAGSIIMGGDDGGVMTVPTAMMSYDDCEIIKAELANGLTGSINPFAPGESCSTAFVVSEGTHTAPALTGGGSLFNDATSTAWYSYTPATDGLCTVASCLGGADTRFYVWVDACDLANITAIATNDDACEFAPGSDPYASSLDFLVTGGTTYWISWDDHWDPSGFDFSISLGPLPIVDVAVTVDMNNETVDPAGAHIAGSFNAWTSTPMTDNGDGTYTFTIPGLTAGDTTEYLFQNGNNAIWEGFAPGGTCTITDPSGQFTNRAFIVPIVNATAGTVCFNSCDPCPPPACADPDAIICDDFEMYNLDLVSGQSAHFTPWGGVAGAADDAIVSDAQAASGTQSLLVSAANGDDMLLLLGDQTTGNYLLTWKMYIPAGNTGYFNTQKIEGTPGGEFGMQTFLAADGTATLDAGAGGVLTYDWGTTDTWVTYSLYVDLTNDWISYQIDGTEIYAWPASYQALSTTGIVQLGAVNFFGNTNTVQYIDDVLFKALPECPADAVICDSYEAYASGSTTGGQAPWWTTWSGAWGTAEDGIVSADQAFDGNNSMYIGNTGAQDVLLLLGNQTEGNWRLEWQMYVPSGSSGYHNIQDDEVPGMQWNLEAYFNTNAANGPYTAGAGQVIGGPAFTHPEDAWFSVVSEIDLDNRTHTFMVDGVTVLDAVDYPAGDKIGGVDFYSASSIHNAYFDAVRFIELDPVVVMPDPVNVTFNVNMESEVVEPAGALIAGEMNAWTGEAMTDNGDETYSATYLLEVGDTVEYKFQNGVDGWEGNFDATCGLNNNRFVIVGSTDMTIDLVCFNSCVDCVPISTEDLAFQNAIDIYPNPATDFTTIEYNFNEATDLTIKLTNSLGQQISNELLGSAQNGTHQMKLSDLATGVYFIQITNGEHSMVEKLFVE